MAFLTFYGAMSPKELELRTGMVKNECLKFVFQIVALKTISSQLPPMNVLVATLAGAIEDQETESLFPDWRVCPSRGMTHSAPPDRDDPSTHNPSDRVRNDPCPREEANAPFQRGSAWQAAQLASLSRWKPWRA